MNADQKLEMQASFDNEIESAIERKRFEWEQAVTEEIRLLDTRERTESEGREGDRAHGRVTQRGARSREGRGGRERDRERERERL